MTTSKRFTDWLTRHEWAATWATLVLLIVLIAWLGGVVG